MRLIKLTGIAILALIIFLVAFASLFSSLFYLNDKQILSSQAITFIMLGFFSIILIAGLISPVFFLVFMIRREIRSSDMEDTQIKFWNKLTPFRPIKTLIAETSFDENIISKKIVIDFSFGVIKISKIPFVLGITLNWPFPAVLIETKDSYFIDRRLQNLVNSIFAIFIGLLVINYSYNHIIVSNPNLIRIILAIGVFITTITTILNTLFLQKIHIGLIKKSWLNKTKSEGRLLSLTGNIPENSQTTLSPDKLLNSGPISQYFNLKFFTL